MVSKVISFFNQPFPSSVDLRSQVREGFLVGLIVFGILFLLRPFNLIVLPLNQAFMICLIFGILTTIVSLAYNSISIVVLGYEYDKPSWTFSKWLFHTLMLIIFISLANFLLMSLVYGYMPFTWMGLVAQTYATLIVGLFPLILFGTVTMLTKERHYSKLAAELNIEDLAEPTAREEVTLSTLANPITLSASNILYVEAMQNYATIYLKDGHSEMIRTTIKFLSEQLSQFGMIRTHRSYLVNPDAVSKVTGNAQGLKLSLRDSEAIVPVSRKYIEVVRDHLDG